MLANRVVRHLCNTSSIQLRFSELNTATLCLFVYVDTSLTNSTGHKSQLGFIILVADDSNQVSFLHFSSTKSKRVTRSSTATETLELVEDFDHTYLIQHDLQRIIGQCVPILMLTDSSHLFSALNPAKGKTERRLMIDMAAL